MKYNFISPLYDFAFAELFGNQKNINNTIGFLKALLDIPEDEYGRLTVVSPKLRKIFRTSKSGIVDLKLTTKSGKIIHIELQVDKKRNMRDRVLYYMCKLIGDQLIWGEDYEKVHQVISIVICNHNMLEKEKSYINQYELRNKENRSFKEKLKLVILELTKLPEAEDGSIWHWLRFLKCKKKEEVDMLAEKYEDLKDLAVSIKNMGLIGYWRDLRFHKNLWKTDIRMREKYVRDEGIEQGIQQGREESRRKQKCIAKNLSSMGISHNDIAKAMEISTDEVKQLII